jgi:hypothetical protein
VLARQVKVSQVAVAVLVVVRRWWWCGAVVRDISVAERVLAALAVSSSITVQRYLVAVAAVAAGMQPFRGTYAGIG